MSTNSQFQTFFKNIEKNEKSSFFFFKISLSIYEGVQKLKKYFLKSMKNNFNLNEDEILKMIRDDNSNQDAIFKIVYIKYSNKLKYGFVTREMIGLEYYPIDYFYFTIGAELHQFYYQHNNNNFINQKISFNYGLGVKLWE